MVRYDGWNSEINADLKSKNICCILLNKGITIPSVGRAYQLREVKICQLKVNAGSLNGFMSEQKLN